MADNFRFFPTRGEAKSFISFAIITALFGASLLLTGIFIKGRPQVVCIALGAGILASLAPIVVDTLLNRGEMAHVTREQHRDYLAEFRALRQDTIREARAVQRQIAAAANHELMGLEAAYLDESEPGCEDGISGMIEDADTLVVMMNYSPNWIARYHTSLRRRLLDEKKSSVFLFMDPRTEAFVAQARKQGREVTRLQEKLADAIRRLDELASGQAGVLGHQHFHVHHCMVSDDQAVVSSFFSAGEKQPSPVFFYRDTNAEDDMFKRLREDARRVEAAARPIRDWYDAFMANRVHT